MYAVIFRAEIDKLDTEYADTASCLRKLAMEKYGCTGFYTGTEGKLEIAISYWPSLEAIQSWKADPEHKNAQALGQSRWYKSYRVQVVEVIRSYGNRR